MPMPRIPTSVENAIGRKAAHDLEKWVEDLINKLMRELQQPIHKFMAGRLVNMFILTNVSSSLMAGDPVLSTHQDGRLVWRVPVLLANASRGSLVQAGNLDVDADFGGIIYTESDLDKLKEEAERLMRSEDS
jgi:hypothetical protein